MSEIVTVASKGIRSARIPKWAPYAAVWVMWALFQLFWDVAGRNIGVPKLGLLGTVLRLAFPFDAGLWGAWFYLYAVATPVLFVLLDVIATSRWRLETAVPRYAVLAVWFGLSFVIAPASVIGYTGPVGQVALELALEFLDGWMWSFVGFAVVSVIFAVIRSNIEARRQ